MKYKNILHLKQISSLPAYWLGLCFMFLLGSACSWENQYQPPNSTKSPVIISTNPASSTPQNSPAQENPIQQLVIQNAINQIGTPYHYGGNNPNGFDCSGLVQYSFARSGIIVPRSTKEQLNFFTAISRSELQAGDVVFFRINRSQRHVAIMLNKKDFVHAPSSGKTVSTSNLSNPYWKSRFLKAGRYY